MMNEKSMPNPLLLAMSQKKWDAAILLINNGADVNIAKDNGKTALYYAKKFNKYDIAKLLVDHGAKSLSKQHEERLIRKKMVKYMNVPKSQIDNDLYESLTTIVLNELKIA